MKLRQYQEQALEAIVAAEARGIKRQLVVLPTGAGKTVIFSSIYRYRSNSLPVLVLAHRDELLDQAADKFLMTNSDLKISKEQASNYADLDSDVVVASIATLGRTGSKRLERFDPSHFKVIVVDEAHHAAANSYKNVLSYFKPDLVVGVTATPQRGDNVRLDDVFDEVVFYRSMLDLMEQQYLAPLRGYRVQSSTDISSVATRAGDYVESELTKAIDTPERNQLLLKAYNDLCQDRPTLIFASTVDHANSIAETFGRQKIQVGTIFGTTSFRDRSDIFQRFRYRELPVIVNVGVLTEGFDEPCIEAIIFGRPTRSPLLYTQIVGRGTRKSSDNEKKNCLIIDVADVTVGKRPVGLPSLLGMPPDYDLEGEELTEAYAKFKKLEALSPEHAADVRSDADIELAYKEIDLFKPPKPSQVVLEHSQFIWSEICDTEYWISPDSLVRISLIQNALGTWEIAKHHTDFGKETLATEGNITAAFSCADGYIKSNFKDWKLLDSEAPWRSDGPTEKQRKFLKRIGIKVTSDMTKGDASQIISKYIEEHPRTFAQRKAIENAKRKRQGF